MRVPRTDRGGHQALRACCVLLVFAILGPQPSAQRSTNEQGISVASDLEPRLNAQIVTANLNAIALTALPSGRRPQLDPDQWLASGFEPVGQSGAEVEFLARGREYTLFLTPSGPRLNLARKQPQRAGAAVSRSQNILAIRFVNGTPHPAPRALDQLPGQSNYFLGSDPGAWRTGIPRYARVTYGEVFPGIDVVYHSRRGVLEYDFVVAPGADPRAIALDVEGHEHAWLSAAGDLVLAFADGQIVQPRPVIYQGEGAQRREIPGGFVLDGRSRVRFWVGPYDPQQPLTIDPELVFSTYLGDTGDDIGCGIALDAAGNIYLAGWTDSAAFPMPQGSGFSTTLAGATDAFVVKLNAAGTELLYSTFVGGADEEFEIVGLAVDTVGSVYFAGSSKSSDYPITAGAFQTSHGGGGVDAVVTKLNASGSALDYSTFLGGAGLEGGQILALDGDGNAYLTGFTGSPNFPVTQGAFQEQYAGGAEAFVSKLSADGASLVYSTYLGGHGDEMPTPGLAVDPDGSAYVIGTTNSPDFPATAGALQNTLRGPSDAYVAKLSPSGGALQFATFLGGTGPEEGRSIAVGSGGEAYLVGNTVSPDFPTTTGAFQAFQQGGGDVFVAKLNANGTALLYSSYFGGSGPDFSRGFGLDHAGGLYVSGATRSADFPITGDALQPAYAGGEDAFVAKFDNNGGLVFSTYFGGSENDRARNMAVDQVGDVSVVGFTNSLDLPLVDPIQSEFRGGVRNCFFAGGCDTFVARIEGVEPLQALLSSPVRTLSGGQALPFRMTLSNVAQEPKSADLSLALRLPIGHQFELLHLPSLTLPPGAVVNVDATLGPLPVSIPTGTWQLIAAWVYDTPSGPVTRFISILDFQVVAQ